MNPFNWLRTAARNAVIGGIHDAISEVAANPEALTVRVELPALAGPPDATDEKPASRTKKKAD